MVPFFVVWLLWNVPIKLLIGYYNPVSLRNILLQMIFPGRVHLWYLECLFFVSVIMFLIDQRIKSEKSKAIIIFIFWCTGYLIQRKTGILHPLGDPLYYLLWYYVGIHVDKVLVWLNNRKLVSRRIALILLIVHVSLYAVITQFKIKIIGTVANILLLPLMMTFIAYYFVDIYRIKNRALVEMLSTNGLAIYLYAEPLNYLALYLFVNIFGIAVLGDEVGAFILWLVRTVVTPALSIGIAYLLRKAKLKYLY